MKKRTRVFLYMPDFVKDAPFVCAYRQTDAGITCRWRPTMNLADMIHSVFTKHCNIESISESKHAVIEAGVPLGS